jgi:stage III sporulation protein AD
MEMVKVAAFALLCAFIASLLKKDRPEIAAVISIVAAIGIVIYISFRIEEIMTFLNRFVTENGIREDIYIIILKVTGIAFITRMASLMLEQMGEKCTAEKVEIAGRVIAVSMILPVATALLEAFMGYM